MKYYLTEQEYFKLWKSEGLPSEYESRTDIWNNKKYPLFKLTYREHNGDVNENGYWGTVEGDQLHINWFLLHL
jgi:hypothetical protein